MLFIKYIFIYCAVFKTKAIIKKQLNCKFMKSTALTVSSIFPIWQWHTSLKWQVHRPPAKKCVIVSKQVML